jgi:hypothetical protein
MLYPPRDKAAFASSNISIPPLLQHALRFACLGIAPRHSCGVSTFYIIDHLRQLRWGLDADDSTVPYRHVRDLYPNRSPLTQGSDLSPANPM